jgi:hypothetical protein
MPESKTFTGNGSEPGEKQADAETSGVSTHLGHAANASDVSFAASSQSFDWYPEAPPKDPTLTNVPRKAKQAKASSIFSISTRIPLDDEEHYKGSGCYTRLRNAIYRLRQRYESEGGGKTRLRLHFLTNIFYLQPKVENSFQVWCVNTQLRSNRNLLMVIAAGFFFYQMFSATKKKHVDLQIAFIIRLAASILFAAIITLLFTCKRLARHWKLMLSFGISMVLGIEVFYRAEKLYIEGGLIEADAMALFRNTTVVNGVESDTSNLFQRVNEIGAFSSNAKAISTALTLLEDELLTTANRYWPMWSVIISVILHIDVIFILPIMLAVLACYVTATVLYIRNPFEHGLLGDSQTMVLLVAMLMLLLWLGHYNDRFLRQTYVQIKDSGAENEKLRKRLKQLGELKKKNEHHPGTDITTPMEGVLLSLNSIKDEVFKGPQASQLGASLEEIIDLLSKPESMKGFRLEDQLHAENADADVTSWLIDQAGLGGGYVVLFFVIFFGFFRSQYYHPL